MISKEAFRLIVTATAAKTGMSQEEMALDMGYGKNYISDILSPSGKLTAKFVKAFQLHFNASSENTKNKVEPASMLELLIQQMTNLMQTQNNLLREQKEQVVDKVKEVDINLKRALQGVSKLVLHVESARVVVLDSLSRLEKRPGSLRKEADKIMDQLEGQQMTHGISTDDHN